MTYLWLKAGHIIFMVFWMAGLFILPRQMLYLYPYDADGLIVVWVLGFALAGTIGAFSQGWFHAKLLLVLLMTGYHMYMVVQAKKMIGGARPLSEKQLKLFGEVPAILLALIVVLVIVKPF